MKLVSIIPSKNRAFQLDIALKTLTKYCSEIEKLDIKIIYKATEDKFKKQYEKLKDKYSSFEFIEENLIKEQYLAIIENYEYILFLVDDNFFVRKFSLLEIVESLENNKDCLGFSLRLGKNINYAYMVDREQEKPTFEKVSDKILKFDWRIGSFDFKYPFEVSSSLYNLKLLRPLIKELAFTNINQLEKLLVESSFDFRVEYPAILCFETSVVFSNPLNMVQNEFTHNRTSNNNFYHIDKLSSFFEHGYEINYELYDNFVPNSCHEDVALVFGEKIISKPELTYKKDLPFISVIIPCYKYAHLLTYTVESIIQQTYKNFEIIIVNDGSPDNTSFIASSLVEKYSDYNIKVIQTLNRGLAGARNFGIENSKGTWLLPLDSDDAYKNTFLAKAVEIITKNPDINLIFSNIEDLVTGIRGWLPPPYTTESITRENTFPYSSLYKKELWGKNGKYNEVLPWGCEDWEFWIRSSKFALKPYKIEEALFLYRSHSSEQMSQTLYPYMNLVIAMIQTLNPDLYQQSDLLSSHRLIEKMDSKTANILLKKNKLYKNYSMLYFWLGIFYEKALKLDLAIENYEKACTLAIDIDWQPFLRLANVYRNYKAEKATIVFKEYQKRKNLYTNFHFG